MRSLYPLTIALAVLATGPSPAANDRLVGGRPLAPLVAIIGGTVLTGTGAAILHGTILLRDGHIVAVGADVPVPAGSEIHDATNRFVTPGFVESHTHLAVDAINEDGEVVSSMVRMQDVLNPTDRNIFRLMAGGVTTAHVLHGSDDPIGGQGTVIKLRWGATRVEQLLFSNAPARLKMALGENPKDMGQSWRSRPRRYPATRPGVEFVIRDAFLRARVHQRERQEFERRHAAGQNPLPPRRDLQLEPLVEVLEGTRAVDAHAYRADDMLMLMRLADELGFKVSMFHHATEAYKISKELAAHGASVATWADWWGIKVEMANAIPQNAALLKQHGVLVSIGCDNLEQSRRINIEAAKTVRWGGLSDDAALALVTISPAKQLGLDRWVGSIEPGKDGDLVVWSAHPLSSYATVEKTFVDGVLLYDRSVEEKKARTPSDTTTSTSDAPPAPPTPQSAVTGSAASPTLAIVHGRVFPVDRAPIENATILIAGRRIVAVGSELPVPAGVPTIDAVGQSVYPGWINARSTVGLVETGITFGASDVANGYNDVIEIDDFNPQLRTRTAFHIDSDAVPVTRVNGVTTAAVTPAGGILGGEIAVMNLAGRTFEEATVKQAAGIAFQFPILPRPGLGRFGPVRGNAGHAQLKRDRDAKLESLSRLLRRARAYAAVRPETRTRDLVLEALVPVVERRTPLFAVAERELEIRDAIDFADREHVKIVISGGLEAPFVAPLLRERHIPVILGPILTLPTREDAWHASSYQAAGQLARAGVRFAFATGDGVYAGWLPFHAAMSVAWGLSRDRAIRALTIDAAEILGVAGDLGSIEPGKIANLIMSPGDPLEARVAISRVIIDGRDVGLETHQSVLYQRYRQQ